MGAEPEHDNLPHGVRIVGLVGVGEVVIHQPKLTKVGNSGSARAKPFKGPPVEAVVKDGLVALDQLLVTVLPLADVVEESISAPPVVVTMSMASRWVGEEEDDVSATRGTDSPLLASSVPSVELATSEGITGIQVRKHTTILPRQHRFRRSFQSKT